MYTYLLTIFCGKAECKCVVRSADTEHSVLPTVLEAMDGASDLDYRKIVP